MPSSLPFVASSLLLTLLCSPALADLPKDFDTLNHKSIFSRTRVTWMPPSTMPAPSTAATVSAAPVLIGILLDDLGAVAILESPGGSACRVHFGEMLPGNAGIVSAISLDYIEYLTAADQRPRRISVGMNLQGVDAVFPAATSTDSSASSTTAPAGGTDGDDLLSRMRRRREQELKR